MSQAILTTAATGIAIWIVVSIPVCLLLGKMIRVGNPDEQRG